jgi:hypothetical protein
MLQYLAGVAERRRLVEHSQRGVCPVTIRYLGLLVLPNTRIETQYVRFVAEINLPNTQQGNT